MRNNKVSSHFLFLANVFVTHGHFLHFIYDDALISLQLSVLQDKGPSIKLYEPMFASQWRF